MTTAQKQGLTWLVLAAMLALVLWLLAPVLTPFVVAAVLAYALAPLVARLQSAAFHRAKLPSWACVLLVEAVFLMLVVSAALLVVPIIAKELPLLREQIPVLAERFNTSVVPWLASKGITVALDVASIKAFVIKYVSANAEDGLGAVLASLKIGGSVALAVLGNAVLVPVALFYLLLDWQQLIERARAFLPPRMRPAVEGFVVECDGVLGQYLRGQLLVMLIMAVFYTLGLALFGLDLALPIGVFTGVAMFVPYVGFGLGLLLATMAGLLEFASIKAVVMVAVVFGLGQLVESLYFTPRFVGERIGLHPLAVIFALLAFGQIFGFVGVLIALPASAVLLVGLRRAKQQYLDSALFKG